MRNFKKYYTDFPASVEIVKITESTIFMYMHTKKFHAHNCIAIVVIHILFIFIHFYCL